MTSWWLFFVVCLFVFPGYLCFLLWYALVWFSFYLFTLWSRLTFLLWKVYNWSDFIASCIALFSSPEFPLHTCWHACWSSTCVWNSVHCCLDSLLLFFVFFYHYFTTSCLLIIYCLLTLECSSEIFLLAVIILNFYHSVWLTLKRYLFVYRDRVFTM